jgi:hypothetical protein
VRETEVLLRVDPARTHWTFVRRWRVES